MLFSDFFKHKNEIFLQMSANVYLCYKAKNESKQSYHIYEPRVQSNYFFFIKNL